MRLLYALINFLILAAGLWFAGRKTVLKRFAERRERIGRELDEAEALEAAADSLSSEPEEPQPELSSDEPAEDTEMEILRRSLAEEDRQTEARHHEEMDELRREAMGSARDQAVRALILELREKFYSTIVIVTHELDSIFTVADRAIFLDSKGGGILADGAPAVLRDSCENPFVRYFLNRGKVK